MEEDRLIVLFGDSLLMDTVEASLEGIRDLGMVRIHSGVSGVNERIQCLGPDLVILDLNTPQSSSIISFLRDIPDIPLLGLDVTCSKVMALSCQQYVASSADDLAQVIRTQAARGVDPAVSAL
jgi:DNA-binding NarL/FixJ family response regulator